MLITPLSFFFFFCLLNFHTHSSVRDGTPAYIYIFICIFGVNGAAAPVTKYIYTHIYTWIFFFVPVADESARAGMIYIYFLNIYFLRVWHCQPESSSARTYVVETGAAVIGDYTDYRRLLLLLPAKKRPAAAGGRLHLTATLHSCETHAQISKYVCASASGSFSYTEMRECFMPTKNGNNDIEYTECTVRTVCTGYIRIL